jgi:hypothetical protein
MPKKRKSSLNAIDTVKEFASVRGKINTAQENLRISFERYRVNVGEEELFRLIKHFAEHPSYKYFVWPNRNPQTHQQASRPGLPTINSFDREFRWATAALSVCDGELTHFVRLKTNFDGALIDGRFEEAGRILDVCDEVFGASLWSTESRLNLYNSATSNVAREAFADAIIKNEKTPFRIRMHLLWSSLRTEKTVSAAQFERMMKKELQGSVGPSYIRSLMMGVCPEIDEKNAAAILSYADTLCMIDRYICYKCTVQALLSSRQVSKDSIANCLSAFVRLERLVDDADLRLLRAVIENKPVRLSSSDALYEAHENFLNGNYNTAIEISLANLRSVEVIIELMVIAIKSSIRMQLAPTVNLHTLQTGPIGKSIFEDLVLLFQNGENAADAKIRLAKLASTYTQCCWSSSLENIIDSETATTDNGRPSAQKIYSALKSASYSPGRLHVYCSSAPFETARTLFNSADDKVSALFSVELNASEDFEAEIEHLSLSRESTLAAQASTAARRSEHAKSIYYLRLMLDELLPDKVKDEYRVFLVDQLVRSKNLKDACDQCAALCIKSNYFASKLPLDRLTKEIINEQEADDGAPTRGKLSTAIVFDMYSRHRSSNRDAEKADAFKDFLRKSGVHHASELGLDIAHHDQAQLAYFLKNICVPEVLDQSLYLENTREVEDERAKILLMLSEITDKKDQKVHDELIEELRNIRTKQVLRDATMRIDQSKIYVNMDGLRRSVDSQMRENWRRYKMTVDSDFSSELVQMGILIKQNLNDKNSYIAVRIPTVERMKLFDGMFTELLDLFTTSKEFGLDANLSTNIRHGYVMKELRNPLVSSRLVTNKGSIEAGYRENDYWTSKLGEDSYYRSELNDLLAAFSEKIDKEIERLNYQLLRLRTDSNPDGLFDFRFSESIKHALEKACSRCETYEHFMEILSAVLWKATEANLSKIRECLRLEVAPNLSNALTQLQSDLYTSGIGHILPELNSAIASVRPELGHAVSRVSSWFSLSDDTEFPDYNIGTAFEAGLQTVKSYYSHLRVHSTFASADDIQLKGFTLPLLARLFFIILDNAAFHSGENRSDLSLDASIERDGTTVHMRIINDLADDKDLAAARTSVKSVLEKYSKDRATEYIRLEGGSGYPKIWKLLTYDLRCAHDLDLSISTDSKFVVDLSFDARSIMP